MIAVKVGYLVDFRRKDTGGGGLAIVTDIYNSLIDDRILYRLQPLDSELSTVFIEFRKVDFIKVYKEISQ